MALPEEEAPAGAPEWVVTFSDMMSLLLTFFILLFSMSELKEEESKAMLESLRRQFGNDTSIRSLIAGPNMPMNSAFSRLSSMGRAHRTDTMRGGAKVRDPAGDHPRVWAIRPAGDVTTGGAVYFTEGSSEISAEDRQVLRQIADEIGGKPQKIEIRGHTTKTPLPPSSPYRTHWDLAYARCVSVMQQLVEFGVEPNRLRLCTAGEYEPVHISPEPALQQRNSRVEVLMTNELARDLEGTPAEKQSRYSSPVAP